MPTNSMLSIRPDYEIATRYGAAWQKQIIDASNLPTVDLYGSQATGSNFFSGIKTLDPLVVNIFGHGNYNIIAAQHGEIYLIGCQTDDVLAGRVVYDLSCRAGRDLASSSVGKGAISFLGYTEDFIFIVTGGSHSDGGMLNPMKDEVSRGFFESHNSAPISYFRGSSIENSFWNSQDTFNYWIDVWDNVDTQVSALLMWDRDHQILLPGGPPTPRGRLLPLVLAFTPLLIIPLGKHLKKMKTL